MRVGYISGSSIPSTTASSMHIMKMCQALAQEGYDVELLVPRQQPLPSDVYQRLWGHYGIRKQFAVRWLHSSLRLRGGDYDLRAVLACWRASVDLIYTRSLRAAMLASLLGRPVVFEAHMPPSGRFGPLYFRLFAAGRGGQHVVCISHALKRIYIRRYGSFVEARRILVEHDAVDLERFENLPDPVEARRQLGLPDASLVVGYSGHLYAGRGVDLILELAQRCWRMHFLVVGGQPQAVADLVEQAVGVGLSNVTFQGFVPNAELPLYLAACDVLLMPYQRQVTVSSGGDTSAFMSPMKMFEYMASGRLIISSDLPVLREILNEGNAVLCDAEDVKAWQQALERGAADVSWREALGRQVRQEVERHTWRRRVQRVISEILPAPTVMKRLDNTEERS